MPCPHNKITLVKRSQLQSAVAAAAYQSGEKLFCEYDQEVKHYPKKRAIVPVLNPSAQMSKLHERQSVWHEKHWQKWLGLNGGKIEYRYIHRASICPASGMDRRSFLCPKPWANTRDWRCLI